MSAPHVPKYGEPIPEVDESKRGTENVDGGHGGEEWKTMMATYGGHDG